MKCSTPGGSNNPTNGTLQWLTIDNVNVDNCEEGLLMKSDQDTGELSYINSNNINNIRFDDVSVAIHTTNTGTSGTGNVQANFFNGIHLQPDVDTTRFS